MPRICGAVNENTSEATRLATAMAEAMCHGPSDVARVWSLDGCALGMVGLPSESIDASFAENADAAAVLCGTVYDDVGVLERFRTDGATALAGLNGRYVYCVWNPQERTLSIAN